MNTLSIDRQFAVISCLCAGLSIRSTERLTGVHHYVAGPANEASRRYSPGVVVGIEKRLVIGEPPNFLICTSHAERQNLSVRMASRRFTRLTNGFSKKAANHAAAVSLYVGHYNLCRVHETLKTTPAV